MRTRRPRVAWFSPLNPDRSGISDYSEEILPHLEAFWEPDLFVFGYRPSSPALAHLRVVDCAVTDPVAVLHRYDAVLYHVGNSPSHEYIYETLLRWPGLLVLHEWAIPHLVVHRTVERGRPHLYLNEMRWQHGDAAAERGRRHLFGADPPPWDAEPLRHPLNQRVLECATGVVAHSDFVASAARAARGDLPVFRIDHHAEPPPGCAWKGTAAGDPAAGRIVFATAGSPGLNRRVECVLRSLARLRGELLFRYDLIGGWAGRPDLLAAVRELGLEPSVRFVGRVDLSELYRHLLAGDVCINLRHPTLGETSAIVMRALACGRPVVVSDVGWFRELPDELAVKIPPGPDEEDRLTSELSRLGADARLRARMGEAARQWAAHRDPPSRARAYAGALSAGGAHPARALGRLLFQVTDTLRHIGVDETTSLSGTALRVTSSLRCADWERDETHRPPRGIEPPG